METIEKQIINTLERIRPFLMSEGGDISFVEYKDGIVYVKMLGACADCLNLDTTITQGVEVILMEEIPGILGIQVVPNE